MQYFYHDTFKGRMLFRGRNFNRRERSSLTDPLCLNKLYKQTLFVFLIKNKKQKLTLKEIFTLFISGGPCHFSSLKHCSGDLDFI